GVNEEPSLPTPSDQVVRRAVLQHRTGIEGVGLSVDDDSPSQGVDALVERKTWVSPLLHHGLECGGVGVPDRGAADQDVVAASSGDLTRTRAADNDVPAGAAHQYVRVGVTDDQIIANAAQNVGDIGDAAQHLAGRAQSQVDGDITRVTGVVQGVAAAPAVHPPGQATSAYECEGVV